MEHPDERVELIAPLAPDCEALRIELIAAQGTGPVPIDPVDVQQQHRSQAPLRRSKWRPDPDTIPVTAADDVIAGTYLKNNEDAATAAPVSMGTPSKAVETLRRRVGAYRQSED